MRVATRTALNPTSEGTNLESEFDLRPTGVMRVLFPLLAPVIRRDVPKQYASLKALCEAERPKP